VEQKDPGRKKYSNLPREFKFHSFHGRCLPNLHEEKVEENGSEIMDEKIESVVTYGIELAYSIIDCQGQKRQEPFFGVVKYPAYIC
jgi:hypothetical protein